ncbi:hypothetical protein K491DRAFT_753705 [Lophiostoma macrostomum CBS 122681]|uniref:F-box domain-containing protein n=1 Tax=Lophiostoma macrostomum CBS 122681 TaxID=1314788 RepID=A0A6A6TPR3_9PLEO|nr:hypothetical protein K491DRAFT_753705 [Lophiostoma macrostomum CBS 122681]
MSGAMNRLPSTIPHLPNELRIRVLSFVDDPHFLWTTCRKVSPEFKQWCEEQYSRDFLPKLQLDMSVMRNQRAHVTAEQATAENHLQRCSEFIFRFKEMRYTDSALALLNSQSTPYSVQWNSAQRRGTIDETCYEDLDVLRDSLGRAADCQLFPETLLGLRPQGQHHVCPCRSIRDMTRRGKCQRYNGIGKFFVWKKEEMVLEVRWKEMLDYVHRARCVSAVPFEKKRSGRTAKLSGHTR